MELADGIRKGERELLKVLLHSGNHRRGAANKEFAVGIVGVLKVLLDVFFGDKANAAFPARRGVIKDEIDLEAVAMTPQQFFQVVLEKDIFLVDVGVDKTNSGFVGWVAENSANDLNHGGDTGTPGNHAEVAAEARGIDEVALGTFDTDGVANLEVSKDPGNVTLLISLKIIVDQGCAKIDSGRMKRTLTRRSKRPLSLSLLTGV